MIQQLLEWRQFLWFTVSSRLVISFLWKTSIVLGEKSGCDCWTCNYIPGPQAIQYCAGFTQTTRSIEFPGKTEKILMSMDRSFYAWTEVFMHRKLHPLRNRDVSWLRSGEKSQNRTLVYNEEIKNPYAGKEQFDWFRQNFLECFSNYVNRVILRHKFLSHSILCVLHSYRKKKLWRTTKYTLKASLRSQKKKFIFLFLSFCKFHFKIQEYRYM